MAGIGAWALVTVVWLLNVVNVAAGVVVLANWSAFNWIVGNARLSLLCEVLVVVGLVYVSFSGCCVLGTERNLERAYKHAKLSRGIRLLLAVGLPMLILTLFGTMTLLSFVETPATDAYVEGHARVVFNTADVNHDSYVSYKEFSEYTLGLEKYNGANTTDFRMVLATVFDAMDTNSDGFLTPDNLYSGITKALERPRERFAWSSLAVTVVAASFVAIFWLVYARLAAYDVNFPTEQASGGEDAKFLDDGYDDEGYEGESYPGDTGHDDENWR